MCREGRGTEGRSPVPDPGFRISCFESEAATRGREGRARGTAPSAPIAPREGIQRQRYRLRFQAIQRQRNRLRARLVAFHRPTVPFVCLSVLFFFVNFALKIRGFNICTGNVFQQKYVSRSREKGESESTRERERERAKETCMYIYIYIYIYTYTERQRERERDREIRERWRERDREREIEREK